MKAHHSSKTQKVAVYSSLFCLVLGAHPAFGAAEGVTVTSDLHLARATVGESAVVRVGAVNIEGTTINGNMTITSKAQVGEISADRSAQVNVASAHFHQAKVQGNAKIELAARTANITAGQGSTVSVGGFEIDNRGSAPSTSLRVATGGGLTIAAGIEQLPGVTLVKNPEKGFGLNTYQNGTLSITNLLHNYVPTKYLEEGSENVTGKTYQEDQSMSKSLQYAYLSKCSYKDAECVLPAGWKVLSKNDISNLGFEPSLFNDDKIGFNSELFYNEHTDEYVLAFEGTKMTSWKDWKFGNLSQRFLLPSEQYLYAAVLAEIVGENKAISGKKITYTGHSLGGGLASMASMVTGEKAVTFNTASLTFPQPLIWQFAASYGIKSFDYKEITSNLLNQKELVTSYFVAGDELTNIDPLKSIGKRIKLPNPHGIGIKFEHGIDVVIESLKLVEGQKKQASYVSTNW